MPCDSIVTQNIEFAQAQGHEELLAAALQEQGYNVTRQGNGLTFANSQLSGTYVNGQFTTSSYTGGSFNVDAVKQAFGKQVVKKAAKQYGWTVTDQGNNKFQIRKRA